ncbi:MAG TPA: hypothetical protein VEB59_13275 [Gemmatimonadales bacterium]|nr:hypothetical protein [Gemmatimonadales bacterium]
MKRDIGSTLATAAALAATLALPSPARAQSTAATPDTAVRTQDSAAAPAAATATPVETRYTLVQVTGRPLPVETEKELRCREEVTAGTLALRDDGRWRLETTKRETCGDRVETDLDDEDGTYRTEGSTLHFLDDDGRENTSDWSLGRDLDLDELKTGTTGEGGALSIRLADDKTVLVFHREGR